MCWGGTAIETDWRPPSSGGDAPGWCYSNMTKIVHEALNSNLDKLVPGFNYGTDAWNLTAFGWHQGWNDGYRALYPLCPRHTPSLTQADHVLVVAAAKNRRMITR